MLQKERSVNLKMYPYTIQNKAKKEEETAEAGGRELTEQH